ncbi:allergen Tha p 1-like [Melitaea cinxia]|uniref:allergen Tha p 1-like n=1 Tax=Melitaea cinxia TaxID=113334 RepID=UPI0006453639|nr:allergen Tha p 1-like [Melitaea cinxia]
MKSIILLFCFAAFVIAEETYDTSSDNINLDELLGNERLITSYSKCLINQGPCTPEVKKLKDVLPEVLETRCAKCSEKQKQKGKQLISEIKKKNPEIWKQLVSFYDPQGKYQEAFQDFLKS